MLKYRMHVNLRDLLNQVTVLLCIVAYFGLSSVGKSMKYARLHLHTTV